jgi:hypothetical protein
LRADRQYLTGFAAAGFTNQVLGTMNLLHIAFLIRRLETSSPPLVVVLPPVTPHYDHLEATEDDDDIDPLPLSAVFDLPAFEQATGLAVVDWHHKGCYPSQASLRKPRLLVGDMVSVQASPFVATDRRVARHPYVPFVPLAPLSKI